MTQAPNSSNDQPTSKQSEETQNSSDSASSSSSAPPTPSSSAPPTPLVSPLETYECQFGEGDEGGDVVTFDTTDNS